MSEIHPEPINLIIQPPGWFKRRRIKAKAGISKALTSLIQSLNNFDQSLTGADYNPNDDRFEDLGPTSDAEKNEIYETIFLWSLRKTNITNIALTGPYGSGKSSVIATFQRKHKQFRYLNISLATFDKEFKQQEDWRQKVELSILQQLIYHVKNRKLPDSRFKKINHTSTLEIFLVTLGLVLLGICFFNIYKPDFIAKFSWWKSLDQNLKDLVNSFSLVIFLLGASAIIYKFYRTIKSLRFSKLGITKGEVELSDKDDKSIFNKHLDEIIYFFQVTQYNVIVIEDLDRFEDAEIFTKLREVNSLVNNSLQVGRQINFVYAVRDDMFKDKDRAKFFDFIIPVIPVINTSNSGDKLGQKLEALKLEEPVSLNFLNTITLYIQDMRLLINIINEFKVYFRQIAAELNAEKLLAIIIYKNIFPQEFAKLHNQEGDVYELIDSKKAYIEQEVSLLKGKIDEHRVAIEQLKEIRLKNIRELRSVYISAIYSEIRTYSALKVGGRSVSFEELLSDVTFEKLCIQSNFPFDYNQPNSWNSDNGLLEKSFAQIEKKVDEAATYRQRAHSQTAISENQIATLQHQISELDRRIGIIQGYTIQQVMNQVPDFTLPDAIAGKPLLAFLVGNGYINEHYPMYISYFIEGSLSQDDMEFVKSITQRKPLTFTHQLKNIETIVTRWLSIGNFTQTEILNVSFMDWVLSAGDKETEVRTLFEQFPLMSERALNFLRFYVTEGKHPGKFLSQVGQNWPGFWDKTYDNPHLNDMMLDNYYQLLVDHAPMETLIKLNGSKKFGTYLASKFNPAIFIETFADMAKVKNVIDKLYIKFLHLPFSDKTRSILDHCYDTNAYVFSPENIQILIAANPGLIEPATSEDVARGQFTVLRKSKMTRLVSHIEADFNNYLANVLLKIPSNARESEETLLYLLDHPDIDENLKTQLIIVQEIQVSDIQLIPLAYRDDIVDQMKMVPNWHNVYSYFMGSGELKDALIKFLNNPDTFAGLLEEDWEELVNSEETAQNAKDLEFWLLDENQIDINVYELVAKQSGLTYDNLKIEFLENDKTRILIETRTLSFTSETLISVQRHFKDLVVKFLLKNESTYFAEPNVLEEIQYLEIIADGTLPISSKIKYLKILTPPDLTGKGRLASAMNGFLKEHAGNVKDFNKEFLTRLTLEQQSLQERLSLLFRLDKVFAPGDVISILQQLDFPFSKLAIRSNKPQGVPANDFNWQILQYLKDKLPDIISSVNPEKHGEFKVNFRREK